MEYSGYGRCYRPLRSPSQSDSELGDKGEQDKEGMMVARSQISMGTPPGGPYSLLTRPFVSRLTFVEAAPFVRALRAPKLVGAGTSIRVHGRLKAVESLPDPRVKLCGIHALNDGAEVNASSKFAGSSPGMVPWEWKVNPAQRSGSWPLRYQKEKLRRRRDGAGALAIQRTPLQRAVARIVLVIS